MNLFKHPKRVTNPVVIVEVKHNTNDEKSYESKTIHGDHYLVRPTSAKEIFALQMLEHRQEKFAPKDGPGVILTEAALLKFR